MVLVTQCRLVWQVAHLHWQRPRWATILLYGNVAAAAFVAQNVEDMDLSELIEPLLAPVLGIPLSRLFLVRTGASLIATSCVDGR
jgi:hypothetical protein